MAQKEFLVKDLGTIVIDIQRTDIDHVTKYDVVIDGRVHNMLDHVPEGWRLDMWGMATGESIAREKRIQIPFTYRLNQFLIGLHEIGHAKDQSQEGYSIKKFENLVMKWYNQRKITFQEINEMLEMEYSAWTKALLILGSLKPSSDVMVKAYMHITNDGVYLDAYIQGALKRIDEKVHEIDKEQAKREVLARYETWKKVNMPGYESAIIK